MKAKHSLLFMRKLHIILTALRKWLLLILLLLACFLFFYFRLHHYLSFHIIKKYEATAELWTNHHYKSALSLYILIYIALVACAIPCATLLTLLGGFLFGAIAVLYAIFGTTFGGMILFLAVRTTIGARIAMKSSGWIKRVENGFQRNGFNYLLMLRLVPVFPCWVSNISAGVLNISLRTFIFATILGTTPATIIYVMVGRGFDKFFSAGQKLNLSLLLMPSIFFPLLGLTLLSLSPVIYKGIKKTNQNR